MSPSTSTKRMRKMAVRMVWPNLKQCIPQAAVSKRRFWGRFLPNKNSCFEPLSRSSRPVLPSITADGGRESVLTAIDFESSGLTSAATSCMRSISVPAPARGLTRSGCCPASGSRPGQALSGICQGAARGMESPTRPEGGGDQGVSGSFPLRVEPGKATMTPLPRKSSPGLRPSSPVPSGEGMRFKTSHQRTEASYRQGMVRF